MFSTHQDWNHSSNYIAKRYIDDVPMARYFDDVMMQMTTKLWAAHYNHHNPPKKVMDYFDRLNTMNELVLFRFSR